MKTKRRKPFQGAQLRLFWPALPPGIPGISLQPMSLTQVVPLDGLDDPVTVDSTATTGEDQEDLEVFRNRVLLRQRTPPQGDRLPILCYGPGRFQESPPPLRGGQPPGRLRSIVSSVLRLQHVCRILRNALKFKHTSQILRAVR